MFREIEEQLIVIPRRLFNEVGAFQGVVPVSPAHLPLLDRRNCVTLARSKAEENPAYKQLVVYFIIHDRLQFLSYWRSPKGGDPRLHRKFSFGFGGHVNAQDPTYLNAVAREIREEIGPSLIQAVELVGLINDDSDALGQVHLGLYYEVKLYYWNGEETGDLNIGRPRFTSWEMLAENYEAMEGWSKLVFGYLKRRGVRPLVGNEMVRVIEH
jgi:predicted NUDIX family phosphoesterase